MSHMMATHGGEKDSGKGKGRARFLRQGGEVSLATVQCRWAVWAQVNTNTNTQVSLVRIGGVKRAHGRNPFWASEAAGAVNLLEISARDAAAQFITCTYFPRTPSILLQLHYKDHLQPSKISLSRTTSRRYVSCNIPDEHGVASQLASQRCT